MTNPPAVAANASAPDTPRSTSASASAASTASTASTSTGTASRLNGLALQSWPLPTTTASAPRSRGTVLIVHGLGEHIGRYEALALQLNAWGFDVLGYDQYGHGQSHGPRGGLLHPDQLLDDLAAVIDHLRAGAIPNFDSLSANKRLILLGHSMGGLVASLFVAQNIRPVTALIVSSPAWDAGLNPLQRLLVALLPSILPNLTVGNGLDPHWISHDPHQVAAYRNDPLVHDRISARLAQFIAERGRSVLAHAKTWSTPTLLVYAGQDKLVHPRGSQQFEALAPVDKVDSHGFANLYHELFNEAEPGRSKVLDVVRGWLEGRFAG